MAPEEEKKQIIEYQTRYHAAAHAMQSGVKQEMAFSGLEAAAASPKHLRVGVNSALVDCGSLATLLLQKGVITELEYFKALAEGMEREKARYEENLSVLMGAKITLA